MPPSTTCAHCGAEIIWAVTSAGQRIAVNAGPSLRVVLTAPPRDGDPPVAAKVQAHALHVLSCTARPT